MLKFNKVLLASDFDNTLVYTQGALERGEDIPPMSARNREAVEYFMQNGGYFSISTGRALPAFARYAQDLPCNAPCVIANGAAIYDFNKDCYVETAFLDADIYDHVDALLARFPGLCFEIYHDDRRIHVLHPNDFVRNHEHLTRAKPWRYKASARWICRSSSCSLKRKSRSWTRCAALSSLRNGARAMS